MFQPKKNIGIGSIKSPQTVYLSSDHSKARTFHSSQQQNSESFVTTPLFHATKLSLAMLAPRA
jgi:hypothetical protein